MLDLDVETLDRISILGPATRSSSRAGRPATAAAFATVHMCMDDEERFRAVFRGTYPALRRYARYRGVRGVDIDDLVAATLEVAWRRLQEVPRDDPLPWLLAVERNLWRNARRAEERRALLVTRLGHVVNEVELDPIEDHAVRDALAQLSEDDQELLRLIAWDGLSPGQAAFVLGCGSVAARSRLHRARNRLSRVLGTDPRGRRASTVPVLDVPRAQTKEEICD